MRGLRLPGAADHKTLPRVGRQKGPRLPHRKCARVAPTPRATDNPEITAVCHAHVCNARHRHTNAWRTAPPAHPQIPADTLKTSNRGSMTTATASGQFTLSTCADQIESNEWLHAFLDRYVAAWRSKDGAGISACVTEDTIWHDPSVPDPIEGRRGVADFVATSLRTFPDMAYSAAFSPVITGDAMAALVPWRITGTHQGMIEPPGFAGTGRRIDIFAIDIWQFRSGLIWRSQSIWNLAEMLEQLEIMPARGSAAERAFAQAQRWRSKLGI
jgi:steroid delta-isomerase-like uncharacterized protein